MEEEKHGEKLDQVDCLIDIFLENFEMLFNELEEGKLEIGFSSGISAEYKFS